MARPCVVCGSAELAVIDQELVNGVELRLLVSRFSLSWWSLYHHRRYHVPATLAKSVDAAEVTRADNLLQQVRDLQKRAWGILDKAEAAGDNKAATSAIREVRGCIELFGKLAGELRQTQNINIAVLAPEAGGALRDKLERLVAGAEQAVIEVEAVPVEESPP